MVSMSFNPVGSWYVVAVFAVIVTGLTIWAYLPRIRTSTGMWRWFALGLRLAAILLCLIAALRPSIVFQEKKKQPATLIFLTDTSRSMTIQDEVRGQKRWEYARSTLDLAREASKSLGEGLTVKYYRFDRTIHDDPADDKSPPEGNETSIGVALDDALKREAGTRVAMVAILSDGANNSGVNPLVIARRLKGQETPIVTVGFGTDLAGSKSRDIAVRDLVTSPTVFVKNNLQIKGTLVVRGFPNETLDLEMLVEGVDGPVAVQRVKVPAGKEVIPITGLSYRPETAGEKRVTLRVKPKTGELVTSNNEVSTFVSVLKGGLNVLFVQGPHAPWEMKYWTRAVATSPDIQEDPRIVRVPARRDGGELNDEDFAPERYDVYVLSDIPANFFTPVQIALLTHAVEKGAGVIMLGGRSSFGAGGWGATELGRIMPMTMTPRDGQIEKDSGIKFVPSPMSLDKYLLQIGSSAADTRRLWEFMPPFTGINRLGTLKENALIFGQTDGDRPDPIMVGAAVGAGRVLAFAGETWIWSRFSDETMVAHRKFWRQVIFWLAHKEDKGENEIKLKLDSRRIAYGQKLDFGVTAKDAKGATLTNLKYETKVTLEGDAPNKFSEKIDNLFSKGDESRGEFIANQSPPGDYRISVVASRDGKEIGHDSARFIVYQDDRELENPAADRALLRQIAAASGGESRPPEELPKYLQTLKGKLFTETYNQTERRIWDNWPFLLIFASLLMLEWFVRKRHGWV